MSALLLSVIFLMRFIQSTCEKKSSNYLSEKKDYFHYGAFRQTVSALFALALLLFAGDGLVFDLPTVLLSVLTSFSLTICMFCALAAMKSGTVVLVSMFSGAGLLVPCIAGIFLFHETIGVFQCIGLLFFFVSAYLLIGSSKKIYTNFSMQTLLLIIGAMLFNGLTMLSQKMFSYYVPHGNVSLYSCLSFGFAGIALYLLLFFQSVQSKRKISPLSKPILLYGTLLSFAVLVISQLATILSSTLSSAVLFSLINGGGTIIASIVAAILFHEKLTKKSVLGIIIGISSLIIIKAL